MLLIHLKSQSSSIKTPMKILHKVLHKLTINVVTGGDPLDGIYCRRCTCESCGNGAHIGYNCLPKVSVISNPEPCHNQNVELAEYINIPSWNIPAFFSHDDDDDEDYTIATTPEEPDNSLSMGDEHLDTIPATKFVGC
nr:hypothetical protein [Tanacetum cinerariifolium]